MKIRGANNGTDCESHGLADSPNPSQDQVIPDHRCIGVELAGVLHRPHVKARYIAVIRCYLDASGGNRGDVAVVAAGYVASEAQWSIFEKEWGLALAEAGVRRFHAIEFYSSEGEFKGWAQKKQDKFAKRFTAIAEKQAGIGIGRGIDLAAFERLLAPALESIRTARTPYRRFTPLTFCVTTCLYRIAWRLRATNEPIAAVIEDGPGSGEVFEYCNWAKRKRNRSWATAYASFATAGKAFRPLQAADLLAHELWRETTEFFRSGKLPPQRKSLKRLLRRDLIDHAVATDRDISNMVPEVQAYVQENPDAI